VHPPRGYIVAGESIEVECLGDAIYPDMITASNGCEQREQWRLCRAESRLDRFYDKNGRLDVIRANRSHRWKERHHQPPRTRDGKWPGMYPDNIAWDWGMPLHTEDVQDPDFGLLEIRYYHGIALEIERSDKRAPVVGGIYVFAMGSFPRLAPLAAAPKDAAVKHGDRDR